MAEFDAGRGQGERDHGPAGQPEGPAVSVIVPAHNDEKYIAECLDSLLAQTFTDWEAVCMDDGSEDGSLAIFEGYARRDARIRVMHQANQGTVAARNNAIAAARGEYIFPLDSDDIIAPDCLELLYGFITTHGCAVVCPGAQYFRDLGGGRAYYPWNRPAPTNWNMYSLQIGLHNSSMYRKASWEKYGGYDRLFDRGMEDFDFWLNFIDDGQKAAMLPGVLFYNRLKPAWESRARQSDRRGDRAKRALYRRLRNSLLRKHPKMIPCWLLRRIARLHRLVLCWYQIDRCFVVRVFKMPVYRKKLR